TLRRDAWWLELLPVMALLGAFGIYATLRAFEGNYYEWGPYLSPFYSPLIDPHHRWWPFSPALLILIWPLGFRVTCYYYRKAYYRAFFLDPPACAVSEGGKHRYRGETAFPFILQNLHRYFLYVGFIFLIFLWRDAFRAFFFSERFGVGLGSLVLLCNVILLTVYALSCHSLRHMAEVNGRPRLTCKTRMDALPLDRPVTVYPMKAFPVIKDLVTDVSWNYRLNKKIPTFAPRPDTDWKMYQQDVDRVQEFRK